MRIPFRRPRGPDLDAELRWWRETWDPVVRAGGFFPGDVAELIGGEEPAPTYSGRRRQIARAEVSRVLREAEIGDEAFFDAKVVVDIGPGALGFPDACPARVSIGVEPLAERFAEAGLLIQPSDAIYLPCGGERIPILSESVDVVLTRNSLDHVRDPAAVVGEATRILRPGGHLIVNVDLDHAPTATEPHSFAAAALRSLLSHLEIERERELPRGHGGDGAAMVVVARR